MDLWAAFRRIGERIEADWHAVSRDERAFPAIARRALVEGELAGLGFAEALRDLLGDGPLPLQTNLDFGQPPATVYRGQGFFIELLFWVDAILSIHRHRFSGAFSVLEGSSLHCRYAFEPRRRINSALILGDVSLLDAELLVRGDCREIPAGPGLIHATFHLERPSVTVVARTHVEWEMGPPYDYRPPSVAFDPAYDGEAIRKRLALLRMLGRVRPDDYGEAVRARLGREDVFGTYLLLEQLWELAAAPAERQQAADVARAIHGPVIDELVPTFVEQDRLRQLVSLSARTDDPALSYFLALLANVPSRRRILELVRARFAGQDPVERVMDFLSSLGPAVAYPVLDREREPVLFAFTRHLLTGGAVGDAGPVLAGAGLRVPGEDELLEALQRLRRSLVIGPLVTTD